MKFQLNQSGYCTFQMQIVMDINDIVLKAINVKSGSFPKQPGFSYDCKCTYFIIFYFVSYFFRISFQKFCLKCSENNL